MIGIYGGSHNLLLLARSTLRFVTAHCLIHTQRALDPEARFLDLRVTTKAEARE
jgi:hypothetical protein